MPYQNTPGRGRGRVVDDLEITKEEVRRDVRAENRKGTRNMWDCARDVKSRGSSMDDQGVQYGLERVSL